MKKLSLKEWEDKYIAGSPEQFDQKYDMFHRPFWDVEIQKQMQDLSYVIGGETKTKAGFTVQDQALRFGSFQGSLIEQLNTNKPNPSRVAIATATAIANSGFMHPAHAYHPPEGAKIDVSNPQTITRDIKKVAKFFGADLVGICNLDKWMLYSHTSEPPDMSNAESGKETLGQSKPQKVPEEIQHAVVMAFEMDYNLIKYYHAYYLNTAVYMGYSRMAFANMCLTAYIQNLGFQAIDCTENDVALTIPIAMKAGLGDLGRMGLLITPQFGPRVRLSKVLTDLPLISDSPIEFGVTEFCDKCKKCADMCPSQAITHGERTVERLNVSNAVGELKWPINGERCHVYWSKSKKDCGNCIAVCPYNKVNSWPHRTVRWFSDHVRWANSFYVKMDDLFGYGKVKNANNFWNEWKPNSYGHF
jgi:reductive dehalogenase